MERGRALAVACRGWRQGRQRDHAAGIVGIGDAEIGDPLLLGEDPAPDLQRGKPFLGSDCGAHLDPG